MNESLEPKPIDVFDGGLRQFIDYSYAGDNHDSAEKIRDLRNLRDALRTFLTKSDPRDGKNKKENTDNKPPEGVVDPALLIEEIKELLLHAHKVIDRNAHFAEMASVDLIKSDPITCKHIAELLIEGKPVRDIADIVGDKYGRKMKTALDILIGSNAKATRFIKMHRPNTNAAELEKINLIGLNKKLK